MIRISQLKITVDRLLESCDEKEIRAGIIGKQELSLLYHETARILGVPVQKLHHMKVLRRSVDARRKKDVRAVYQIEVSLDGKEGKAVNRLHRPGITYKRDNGKKEHAGNGKGDIKNNAAREGSKGDAGSMALKLVRRPVVVGMGPAGLFCALELARAGLCPIVIEQGADVDTRARTVEQFWKTGALNPYTNVQFGEGGAGSFSDGKLNTLVKDSSGRNRKVIDTLLAFGAPEEISYLAKPHIGTDLLRDVVKQIRKEILRLGGTVRFLTKMTDIHTEDGRLSAITVEDADGMAEKISCNQMVLAIGHSARETFVLLDKKKLDMQPKAFAIGVRMEHPQELIGKNQYGVYYEKLPAADYKLTFQTEKGRGVYSFCMCPGGYVVNASSEKGHTVVNGMSNHARDGRYANSAVIVSVTPEDFAKDGNANPLAGVAFQRKWEALAYEAGQGKIPVQSWGDFKRNRASLENFPQTEESHKGGCRPANVRACLPSYVSEALMEAMPSFGKKIEGFDGENVLVSGVETRTSSPVRIVRNEGLMSNIAGIYPCGEGAGYAGGIMSAAMDGLKVAESVCRGYTEIEKSDKKR